MSFDKEIEDGKRIVDAAKAAGVSHLIWSGLEPVKELSGGKLKHVEHFDSKVRPPSSPRSDLFFWQLTPSSLFRSQAVVTAYALESGLPTTNVEAGCYMQNWLGALGPRRQADGSLVFAMPIAPSTKIALIDTNGDYGAYVREAIEGESFKPGSEILAAAEEISLDDMVKQFSEGASSLSRSPTARDLHTDARRTLAVTGAKASYYQLPHDDFLAAAGPVGKEMLDMFLWFEQFGCASLSSPLRLPLDELTLPLVRLDRLRRQGPRPLAARPRRPGQDLARVRRCQQVGRPRLSASSFAACSRSPLSLTQCNPFLSFLASGARAFVARSRHLDSTLREL